MTRQTALDLISFIPAIILTIATIILFIPLYQDTKWPIHFNFYGIADGFETAKGIPLVIVIQVILLVVFMLLDRGLVGLGRWNFAPFLASFFTGMQFCLIWNYTVRQAGNALPLTWSFLAWEGIVCFLAIVLSLLLNWRRQPPVSEQQAEEPDLLVLVNQSSWLYWEHVTALWIDGIIVLVLLLMSWVMIKIPNVFWETLFLLLVSLLSICFIGGYRLAITADQVKLTWGWLQIPLLKIPVENIATIEVKEFSAIHYGGYGIRYGISRGWGFILYDNGIVLTTKKGTRIAISTKKGLFITKLIQIAMDKKTAENNSENAICLAQ